MVKDKDIPSPFNAARYKAGIDFMLNGHSSISAGSILAEDGSGRFRSDTHNLFCGKIDNDENQKLVELALLQIAEQVSFSHGALPSPLLPSRLFNEEGELNELERLLEGVLEQGNLHEISRRPRFDMRYDEMVLPVSRAKRLASSAERHLAAHSECWQRRTLTGIQPRKIKGLISEDEFNLYENRVYVRLLDGLDKFLAKRIREINALTTNLTEALEIEGSDQINYRLSRRLFSIWGETFHPDTDALDTLGRLESTQEVLRKQYQSVRGLIQHKFYRMIPQSAQIPGQIEQTNILSHDQHYRHLPKLWNTLRKQNHSENLTPKETLEANVKLQQAYFSYCGVVVFRAFQELGFELICSETDSYDLQRLGGRITLTFDGSHWDITYDGFSEIIRLVPIFSWSPERLCSLKENGILTIPCCLESERVVGHPSDWIDGGGAAPMVMSPLNFYVEEQMVSLLSLWLLEHSARSYGNEITLLPQLAMSMMDASKDYECLTSKSSRLVALPSKVELDDLENILARENARQSLSQLKEYAGLLKQLSICPCCQGEGRFTPRDNRCFVAQCQKNDCNLEWNVSISAGRRVLTTSVAGEGGDDFKVMGRWSSSFNLSELDREG